MSFFFSKNPITKQKRLHYGELNQKPLIILFTYFYLSKQGFCTGNSPLALRYLLRGKMNSLHKSKPHPFSYVIIWNKLILLKLIITLRHRIILCDKQARSS